MSRRPTQVDVARLAGVSRATVSYVLNDRTEGRISITEETRKRVQDAARELGYKPHALARSLRSGLSNTVGLLIPDTHNPHYLDILSGAEQVVMKHDCYLVLVSASLDPERERHCLRSLFQRRLDGLILVPTFADLFADEIEELLAGTDPVVFVTPQPTADCAYANVRGGAEALMDHLIALGHRRIGFVHGVARKGLAQQRMNVYRQRIEMLGAPADECLIRDCGHTIYDGYLATRELLALDPPPTAIWTVNDLLAIGALRAVRERGLRVPHDISLAGFDDIELAAQLYPPLTTVNIHGEELGRRAAQTLFRRIENPDCGPIQQTIDAELVVRQSTAPPRYA
jgi:DNA-binding LacI/PurR family transcriptional regulator